MHDRNGKALKAGDLVNVPCVVKHLGGVENFCNVELETVNGRRPDGKKETISAINSGVVLLNSVEVGAVAVCSLGRVGVITGKETIVLGNDTKEMWVGMGLDGKGLWASSEPIVITTTLKDYTQMILAKPNNVLYGTIAVPPPPKKKAPEPKDEGNATIPCNRLGGPTCAVCNPGTAG
jgi:hypothetical protein